jgi:hypothetical protein
MPRPTPRVPETDVRRHSWHRIHSLMKGVGSRVSPSALGIRGVSAVGGTKWGTKPETQRPAVALAKLKRRAERFQLLRHRLHRQRIRSGTAHFLLGRHHQWILGT